MFSKIDVYVNNSLITDQTDMYPYESYLTKTLNYSKDAKEFQFANSLYVKDQAGRFDNAGNTGFVKRKEQTKKSKQIELLGRLQVDLFNQPKFLLPNVPLKIDLHPSTNDFCLFHDKAKGDYRVKIEGVTISLSRVTLNPKMNTDVEAKLKSGHNVHYPVLHNTIKTFEITTGSSSHTVETLFSGSRPRRVVLGLVDTEAVNGDPAKNPFNFEHGNVSNVKLQIDSVDYPKGGIDLNYTTDEFGSAYEQLLSATGLMNDDKSIDVTKEDFKKGTALYVVAITAADPECPTFDPIEKGNVRVEITFRAATTKAYRAIVMAEFERVYHVDLNRNLTIEQ